MSRVTHLALGLIACVIAPAVSWAGPAPGCPKSTGADVILAEIPNVANYAGTGDLDSFAFGTTACNVGDEEILWIDDTNEHPVIAQHIYRLKDGRFEQVGQAWLKHGFSAQQDDFCGCGCIDSGTRSRLGIGCSDPYSANVNGIQSPMGPKSEVNPFTGYFRYPPANPSFAGSLDRRMQVKVSDLDPSQNGGGTYFLEGQYISLDDSAAGNQMNNASYRQVNVVDAGGSWDLSLLNAPPTVQRQSAIQAWKLADPEVVLSNVLVPGDGKMHVAARATDLGNGMWRYEYAVHNFNCDRAVGSFRVPVDLDATVQNIGFHDVDYHSGEIYDGTDWPGVVANGFVSWSTQDIAVNPAANALRWGTLYNFRFDADVPPHSASAVLKLFKPGVPLFVLGATVAPITDFPDCNDNGLDDAADIAAGRSIDCNDNGVPDECETFEIETPLNLVEIASGFEQPLYAASPPGDFNRLFVVEQTGRIRIINLITRQVLSMSFLNMTDRISVGGERGLLGMAFHPDYAANGRFYVNYTDINGDSILAQFNVQAGNANRADPDSEVVIRKIDRDFPNHNAGCMQFGPDGMLYVPMGDGGDLYDPYNRSQDPGTLLGKILRFDVDHPENNYIPADNPFVGPGGPLDEIWALGLRNPWRFSFDSLTGDMYLADVGQNDEEELNFQPASSIGGENYGWRCREGNHCTGLSGCTCNDPALTSPIHTYPLGGEDEFCAIIGGYVYRGCKIPDLNGAYFFGDFCNGRIQTLRYDGQAVSDLRDRTGELTAASGPVAPISSFGVDAEGEIYVTSFNGKVYKIEPVSFSEDRCGDGVIDIGEECDDGNFDKGDGCDSSCKFETFSNDTCAAAERVCPGVYFGNTDGLHVEGSATCGQSNNSPDVWFSYTPAFDGTLTVDTCGPGTLYDTVLSVHSACVGSISNQLACDDGTCGTAHQSSRIELEVEAKQTYIIRLSGFDTGDGAYELRIDGPECVRDCNGNELSDFDEIAAGSAEDCNENLVPDRCDIAEGDSIDLYGGPLGNPVNGGQIIANNCRGCHNDDGSGGKDFPGPNLRDHSRVEIWNMLLPPTRHPGGSHPEFTVQNFADLEAFLADTSAPVFADRVPDECQRDCNSNGVPDFQDISGTTSEDCNGNKMPDECEPEGSDCNGNGEPDTCDLFHGTSLDQIPAGGDHIPDECQNDCNGNGVLDLTDLAGGTSLDCNQNQTPDECDVAIASADCDGNDVPDVCQLAGHDCNANGKLDACELEAGSSTDCNNNDQPDECELAAHDCNGNDIPDDCDVVAGVSEDCNDNLVPDACEIAVADCNNNGDPDDCDVANNVSGDCNGNKVPDECEIAAGTAEDCNDNGRPDACDILKGQSTDCDGNDVPDGCELDGHDCNGNDIHDACDIAAGREQDVVPAGGDGIPDSCISTPPGPGGNNNNGGNGNNNGGNGNNNGGNNGQLPPGAVQITDNAGNSVIVVPPTGSQVNVGDFLPPDLFDAPPANITLPFGVLSYEITGIANGAGIIVTITLAPGTQVDSYYKYGPTQNDSTPHWYEFLFDGQTGAQINGNVITVHFIDGQRGDDDLAANGIIVSTEAPVLFLPGAPLGVPGQDCGAGLCGMGATGMMPFMLLGTAVLRGNGRRRRGRNVVR